MASTSNARRRLAELVKRKSAAAVARVVGLSEGAVRHHLRGSRAPSAEAVEAYETKLHIARAEWQEDALPAPTPMPAPSEPRIEELAAKIASTGGGVEVLTDALASAKALYLTSAPWPLRDRIAVLSCRLAAIRGLVSHEAPTPTRSPEWRSVRDKILSCAAGMTDEAELLAIVERFEAACARPHEALDLKAEVRSVLDAAAQLAVTTDIGEREAIALQGLRVAAGRLATRIERVDGRDSVKDARWLRFKSDVFQFTATRSEIRERMAAVPIPV